MMTPENLIRHLQDYSWIYPRGREADVDAIRWKTLVSGDRTPTCKLIMGILEVPPGAKMNTHRHEAPEVYFVYDGVGEVFVDGVIHEVVAGSILFLNGNSVHGVRNSTDTILKLMWMFPGDSFADIEYHGEQADF